MKFNKSLALKKKHFFSQYKKNILVRLFKAIWKLILIKELFWLPNKFL